MSLFMLFSVPFWATPRFDLSGSIVELLQQDDTTKQRRRNLRDSDSLRIKTDSLHQDSLSNSQKKPPLDAVVDYKSNDSIVMTQGNWGYLYGEAEVNYGEIKLSGEVISMNMDSTIVEATFGLDSIGKEFGYPVFNDGGTDYETKTMKYNFKTKKGFSQHLVTQQGEGYVIAGKARKNEDDSFFMREGMYTTCDQHDHPHFYLALTKAKVQPKKNVVTGPAYLVIEDLHIPFIGLPFAFFPFTDSYSSGVIMPSYGDELDRGFNLHDGGYYFAFSDYVDLKLLGTIFTKGSWALNGQSTYRKRYKYSGNVNVGYQYSKYGDKGLPDYSVAKDFKIGWTHAQDAKANEFKNFSASVNFSTSSYNRTNLNTAYAPVSTQNTKSSTVNFTQRFPDSPWSYSANMSINQISSDSSIAVTLPTVTIAMSRVFPFKRKDAVGADKWYEKIQINYTGDLRNTIKTKENEIFKKSFNAWDNAMQHTVPISATFSVFNNFNITPSVQYRERWYTQRFTHQLVNGQIVRDKEQNGFYRVYDFNASVGLQTKLYGFFTPIFSKNTKIRHVFTPSISLNAAPDFGDSKWGYWETLYGYDAATGLRKEYYVSPYEGQIFGIPGRTAQGTINFDFQNNVEMKIPWESDSLGFKKISLIDNLGINFSYNTQAEEFKWSNPTANLRLRLSKSLTVNLNSQFDLYTYEFANDKKTSLVRVDKLRIDQGRSLARLMRTGYSISPTINQETFAKWFGKDQKSKEKKSGTEDKKDDEASKETKRLLGEMNDDGQGEYDADGYLRNQIKWTLGFSYSMNYAYNTREIDIKKQQYKMKLTHSLSFNGSIQPTANWNMSFYGSYDFELKNIPHMSCTVTRDLHCWSISASFTPVGPYKNYYVSLRANSSMLQDLKHEFKGRSSSYDPTWD